MRTLVETQALIGSRGAYRLAQPLTTIRIRGTVQAILAARIDRLSPSEKHLLQCASVIGREVPFVLLRQIAEVPEEQLRLELTYLQGAEFLYETSVFPESEYTFKHALTHDVAYGGLLQERRRSLHARMVTIIESVYAGRGEEQVERLALHAYRGELWPKAVEYFRRAGAKAMALAAHREAATCFEQALVALRKEPESRENQERVIDLLLDLRGALYPLGEFNKMLQPLREAERLAEAIGDSTRLCWVSLHLGDYLRQIGDLTAALNLVERAHGIAETLQNLPVALVASYYLGLSCHTVGDYRRAAENASSWK